MAQPLADKQAPGGALGLKPNKRIAGFRKTQITDWFFRNTTLLFALSTILLILGMALALYLVARQNIHYTGLRFLTETKWDPTPPDAEKLRGNIFGAVPFIYGTLLTSLIALLLALPLSLGAAIFLSEVAPRWLNAPLSFLVELLAAVPSIVYGFWALAYLVPLFKDRLEPWLSANFGHIPFFALPSEGISGQDFLVAGIILALMILPFITAVSRDVLRTVPNAQREAALGMGATRWEAIRDVVLRYGSSGIIGAAMLGLGRALGETMAVTIVIGSAPSVPHSGDPASFSLLRPGYTMASKLADEYPNPNSPLHASALTEIALLLFAVTILVNALARGLVWLMAARHGGSSGSEWSLKLKAAIGVGARSAVLGLIALLFLYQAFQDVRAHGVTGLFGAAELLGLGLLALGLFRWRVPGTRFYPRWRKLCNGFALMLCGVGAFAACAALLTLLFFVARDGFSALNGQFFRPPNPGNPDAGGMLHAIVGTGLLILVASAIGVPFGILGGLFLAEFGNNRIGAWTRFAADLLNGVPSIVVGIFAYLIVVAPTRSNFGFAGGVALGILMIPTVMRTTEELVRLVPMSLREGSLALGATHARTVWQVVLPVARGGILTGVLLAVARVAGETAPLLMVGCNSNLWITDLRQRMSSLPVQIYVLRDDPRPLALQQSWGVALVLVLMVLVFSLLARLALRSKMRTAL
ncbi:MAG TPA: phosphate ABC transporter permease subunit PstC [Chthonomonadaceae bacterium]|nr:phosphate ABC transporter permease subunit PstC [Chthonomonadaceae bacterium]